MKNFSVIISLILWLAGAGTVYSCEYSLAPKSLMAGSFVFSRENIVAQVLSSKPYVDYYHSFIDGNNDDGFSRQDRLQKLVQTLENRCLTGSIVKSATDKTGIWLNQSYILNTESSYTLRIFKGNFLDGEDNFMPQSDTGGSERFKVKKGDLPLTKSSNFQIIARDEGALKALLKACRSAQGISIIMQSEDYAVINSAGQSFLVMTQNFFNSVTAKEFRKEIKRRQREQKDLEQRQPKLYRKSPAVQRMERQGKVFNFWDKLEVIFKPYWETQAGKPEKISGERAAKSP